MLYLLILTSGMVASYFVLAFVFSILLEQKIRFNPQKNITSIIIIIGFTFLAYFAAIYLYNIDKELSNRFLHAIDGAFNVVIVCFLVIKDFNFKLSKLQFVIVTLLFVSFFGILNEILEYIIQVYFNYIFSPTPLDTWLDLISNSLGAILGIVSLIYFVPQNERNRD